MVAAGSRAKSQGRGQDPVQKQITGHNPCESETRCVTSAALATAGTPRGANAANTIHQPNVGPMLGQRRRRWTNIGTTLG